MNVAWIVIGSSFVAVTAVAAALILYGRVRQLRRELGRAEARHLRGQLNPHFLFNTLTAVSELGYNDPAGADRTITALSKLLRMSLDSGSRHEISLKDELDILQRYLDIQQTLLQGRLTVEFEVEPETLSARVPGMILQPLAENAVIHGITAAARGGRVRVAAQRRGDELELTVTDDGPGLRAGYRERLGVTSTRKRLANLYGRSHRFELGSRDGGAVARIVIPFHEAFAYDEDTHTYR